MSTGFWNVSSRWEVKKHTGRLARRHRARSTKVRQCGSSASGHPAFGNKGRGIPRPNEAFKVLSDMMVFRRRKSVVPSDRISAAALPPGRAQANLVGGSPLPASSTVSLSYTCLQTAIDTGCPAGLLIATPRRQKKIDGLPKPSSRPIAMSNRWLFLNSPRPGLPHGQQGNAASNSQFLPEKGESLVPPMDGLNKLSNVF